MCMCMCLCNNFVAIALLRKETDCMRLCCILTLSFFGWSGRPREIFASCVSILFLNCELFFYYKLGCIEERGSHCNCPALRPGVVICYSDLRCWVAPTYDFCRLRVS